ncbi:hypothetical protein [Ideonella sp. A 288]|uniref:hypothetical protein n=1 Tax=Ideonella sp. A 288 TaxID=1962181 RepID=UPI000B4ABC7E|nr:hypothetical protein [Ideonella sp. A 288]
MTIRLPDYTPPNTQRANVAVGASPLLVLLAFTLLVIRVIDPDTGFAILLACTVWVAYEMHDYQKSIDDYNSEYASRHLVWRSSDTLEAMVAGSDTHGPTREFVLRYLSAGRVVLLDGVLPRVH